MARNRSLGQTHGGDWVKFKAVDFGAGSLTRINAHIALAENRARGALEPRLGSLTGPLLGTLTTRGTGGWKSYKTQPAAVAGVHDLCIIFRGGPGVADVDWITFA